MNVGSSKHRGLPDGGTVLLLGGRSEIGVEIATRLAPGRTVVLAARRSGDLEVERRAVLDAGAENVACVEFDADDLGSHAPLLESVTREYGAPVVTVLAFGVLGDQERAEREAQHAVDVIHTDFVAQVGVLTHLANLLRERGRGTIVVFSSIAGVRVRRANYVYGSAKAGLDGFASGLGDALHGTGVSLMLVRSGFVTGRMTEGMPRAPLSRTPGQVADAVVRGLQRGASRVTVPRRLRPAFLVMQVVPQSVWRRMPR
ncbi:SDR family NAD(P)-dependent oxidoreductase [Rhodococcus sp. NPDC058521]|uniref:SDR family NAD(P)-dependent oxidoreductase n=1 Tax=Rhodococcus sp. NPDC058521 TaxID=3346536 RepID=UPI0036541DEA